ncbi:MAG: hypothetical protein AAF985_17785 [Bacteroidota bacterium]
MSDLVNKTLLDQFEYYLASSYENYYKRQEWQTDHPVYLIRYLIDHNLIRKTTIRRYAILKEYERLTASTNLKKVRIVEKLSHRFNLSERSIYLTLKEHRNHFERSRKKF